jgi:hypothetical protein
MFKWAYYETKWLWGRWEKLASNQENDSYDDLFVQFSEQVEKLLVRVTVIFFLLLVLAQGLLQFSSVRMLLTRVELMEGKPYGPEMQSSLRP